MAQRPKVKLPPPKPDKKLSNHSSLSQVLDSVDQLQKDLAIRPTDSDIKYWHSTGNFILDQALGGKGLPGGRYVEISGLEGVGKAQPLTAKVLTPDGFVTMGSLRVGDPIIGKDGHPYPLLAIWKKGVKPIYRLRFSDGSSTECCEDHMWWVRHHSKSVWEEKPLKELFPICTDQFVWHIPLCEPVNFTLRSIDQPLDPYLAGALLGNCDFPAQEMSARLNLGTVMQRKAFLAGLLDTHGRAIRTGGVEYMVESESLMRDVVWMVRSLGGVTRIEKPTMVDGREHHRCSINLKECPFWSFSKVSAWVAPSKQSVTRILTRVERVGEEECQCLTVDSPDSTYITDDFIVTHNSTQALEMIRVAQENGGVGVYLDLEVGMDAKMAQDLAGVDTSPSRWRHIRPDSAEEGLDFLDGAIERFGILDIPAVIVLDSIPALVPAAEMAVRYADESQMAGVARLVARCLRRNLLRLNCASNVLVVLINHLTTEFKTDRFSRPVPKSSGGRAVCYYPSVRLRFERGENNFRGEGEQKFVESREVDMVIWKNRCGPEQRMVTTPFNLSSDRYDRPIGFDDGRACLNFLQSQKMLVSAGGGYYYFAGMEDQPKAYLAALAARYRNEQGFRAMVQSVVSSAMVTRWASKGSLEPVNPLEGLMD